MILTYFLGGDFNNTYNTIWMRQGERWVLKVETCYYTLKIKLWGSVLYTDRFFLFQNKKHIWTAT
jgi:hypothetical protein